MPPSTPSRTSAAPARCGWPCSSTAGTVSFPIRADHVGKNLPTAQSEKVQVRLSGFDGGSDVVRIAGGEER